MQLLAGGIARILAVVACMAKLPYGHGMGAISDYPPRAKNKCRMSGWIQIWEHINVEHVFLQLYFFGVQGRLRGVCMNRHVQRSCKT